MSAPSPRKKTPTRRLNSNHRNKGCPTLVALNATGWDFDFSGKLPPTNLGTNSSGPDELPKGPLTIARQLSWRVQGRSVGIPEKHLNPHDAVRPQVTN